MAELQHSQIKSKLLEGVVPLIDMADVSSQPADQFEVHGLSRAVAAIAVRMASDAELSAAAASIVDGGDDNGIDAIYYDPQAKSLF